MKLPAESYPYGLALDEAGGRLRQPLGPGRGRGDRHGEGRRRGDLEGRGAPERDAPVGGGKVLYVANANRNTVSVFDAEAGRPLATLATAIHPQAPSGCTPNALALSPDESILFVANANTNDVAAFNVADPAHGTPLGFIPAGWYPTSVRAPRDGKTLWIVNGKGTTSKANRDGPTPGVASPSIREYIGGLFKGTLSVVAMPTPKQMATYTKTVYECCPLAEAGPAVASGPKPPAGNPIPGAGRRPVADQALHLHH